MTTIPTVEIPFGDTTLDLKVGLAQSKQINSAFGGFVAAYQKVTGLDLQACIAIVALGADKPAPEVEAALYAQGLHVLKAPLERYLNLLANGGREKAAA
jgi:hypothetical protein